MRQAVSHARKAQLMQEADRRVREERMNRGECLCADAGQKIISIAPVTGHGG
jgi:hypothetical protein